MLRPKNCKKCGMQAGGPSPIPAPGSPTPVNRRPQTIDEANVYARNLAFRRQLVSGENTNVGNSLPAYKDAQGNLLPDTWTPVPQNSIKSYIPPSVTDLQWSEESNLPYYMDPNSGDIVYTNRSNFDLPRFQQNRGQHAEDAGVTTSDRLAPKTIASRQMGGYTTANDPLVPGVNAPVDDYQYTPPQYQNRVQEGFAKGIIEPPKDWQGSGNEWYNWINSSPQKKNNPAPQNTLQQLGIAMKGLTTGLGEVAGRVERGRQNQYDYDQQTALGQMNPMPSTDYQPNPYSLYAKYGGSLRKYQQGGTRKPIITHNINDPRIRAYQDSLNLHVLDQDYMRQEDNYEKAKYNEYIKDPSGFKQGSPSWYARTAREKRIMDDAAMRMSTYNSSVPNEPDYNSLRTGPTFELGWTNGVGSTPLPQLIPTTQPTFKKPIQPYVYQPLVTPPTKKPVPKKVIPPAVQDTIPMPDTTRRLKAFQQGGTPSPHYKFNPYFSKPIPDARDSAEYRHSFNDLMSGNQFAMKDIDRTKTALYALSDVSPEMLQFHGNVDAGYEDAQKQMIERYRNLRSTLPFLPQVMPQQKYGGLQHVDYFGPPFSNGAKMDMTDDQKFDRKAVGKIASSMLRGFAKYGGIHIKPENKGKFTDYCGGKVTGDCIDKGLHSPSATIRKRANFARNSRSWNN